MKDGAKIFYKDWGTGSVITFSHGWPLTADAWDAQMFYLGSHGYRVIAHDRRSHGRSDQTWNGNDMDTYADDLARTCRPSSRPNEFDRTIVRGQTHPAERTARPTRLIATRADIPWTANPP